MKDRQRRVAMWAAIALYLVGLGFLGGITVERVRFSRERGAAVARFETAAGQLRVRMMTLERGAPGDDAVR